MNEGYAFDETDEEDTRMVMSVVPDGRAVFSIFNAAGEESDAFAASIAGAARLAAALSGGAAADRVYTLGLQLAGDVTVDVVGPDPGGVLDIATAVIGAFREPVNGGRLTRELLQAQDELGRYRLQDDRWRTRVAELEAGVKLLEEQSGVLARVREALRAAGRNEADPVASIRGLRVEAQGVAGRVAEATRAKDDEIKTLRGQLGYQREQVDTAQKALREAVKDSTDADAKANQYVTQLRATIEEERSGSRGLGARISTLEGQLRDTTELNNALVVERDSLRDALDDMMAEMCDTDTGESRETHFSSEEAAVVVARGRRVVREIYGD